jgi:hypothetical protein
MTPQAAAPPANYYNYTAVDNGTATAAPASAYGYGGVQYPAAAGAYAPGAGAAAAVGALAAAAGAAQAAGVGPAQPGCLNCGAGSVSAYESSLLSQMQQG